MDPSTLNLQAAHLSPHGIAMGLFTVVLLAIFIWDRWPVATVSLAMLVAIPLGFELMPYTGTDGPVEPSRWASCWCPMPMLPDLSIRCDSSPAWAIPLWWPFVR